MLYLAKFASTDPLCRFAGAYYCPALTPAVAAALDEKIDDGSPTSGAVLAMGDFVYLGNADFVAPSDPRLAGPGGPAAPYCLDNSRSPAVYNARSTSAELCLLQYTLE